MLTLGGLCALLAALSQAVAGDTVTYFTDWDTLTFNLAPPYPQPIKSILWKFSANLAAEWVKDKVPLEFYSTFRNRSELDITDARLVVLNATREDAGAYTVEINSKVHAQSYDARWIKKLEQPEAVVAPLTCGTEMESCTVRCETITAEAEPVTYSWRVDEKEWMVSNRTMVIKRIENANDKTFTCRVSNPLGEQVSAPVSNPLYSNNTATAVAVGILVPLALCVAVAVGYYLWRQKKKDQPPRPSPDPSPGDPSPKSTEEDPLKPASSSDHV